VITPLLLLRLRKRMQRSTLRGLTLVLLAAFALFVGALPGQTKPHYLVPVVALLALAVASFIRADLWLLTARGQRRVAQSIALALSLIYLGAQIPSLAALRSDTSADSYLDDDRRRFDLDGLVAHIEAHTRPDAAIWVYFDAPEIYVLSNRRPATRDPSGSYLTQYWQEPWFSRTASELAVEQPDLIIGINEPRYTRRWALALTEIPRVGAHIARMYDCDSARIRGAIICSRTSGDLS
jgi:hypothetical protein